MSKTNNHPPDRPTWIAEKFLYFSIIPPPLARGRTENQRVGTPSAAAAKSTSPDEFSIVSKLSCTTPRTKPTPTTCMATSFPMPKSEHAIGMSRSDPPATPDAPHAAKVASTLRSSADAASGRTPSVCAAASAITVIVTAAPLMLTVAPNGTDTE